MHVGSHSALSDRLSCGARRRAIPELKHSLLTRGSVEGIFPRQESGVDRPAIGLSLLMETESRGVFLAENEGGGV